MSRPACALALAFLTVTYACFITAVTASTPSCDVYADDERACAAIALPRRALFEAEVLHVVPIPGTVAVNAPNARDKLFRAYVYATNTTVIALEKRLHRGRRRGTSSLPTATADVEDSVFRRVDSIRGVDDGDWFAFHACDDTWIEESLQHRGRRTNREEEEENDDTDPSASSLRAFGSSFDRARFEYRLRCYHDDNDDDDGGNITESRPPRIAIIAVAPSSVGPSTVRRCVRSQTR